MERRRARRHKRRLPVRFFKPGEADPHEGFTTNISAGGMFVATGSPARPGARIRVETLDPAPPVLFMGHVIHASRVDPALRRIRESGMGLRFLEPAELVAELLPSRPSPRPAPSVTRRGVPSAEAPERPCAPAPAPAEAPPAEADPGESPVYLVRFASPSVFLDVFRTQYRDGEFFVPTHRPAPIGREVVVELELLDGHRESLRLPGRVADHVGANGDGAGPPKGMNVSFLQSEQAAGDLRGVIRRLRGRGLA